MAGNLRVQVIASRGDDGLQSSSGDASGCMKSRVRSIKPHDNQKVRRAGLHRRLHARRFGDAQSAEVKPYCDLFKKIRHVACRGEIHCLASLRDHPYAAFEYVLPDASEALLFVFAHGLRHNERVPNMLLESLDPEKTYDVEVYGEAGGQRPAYRAVSEVGVLVDLTGDYDSRILHFKAR
ncbi:MAG: hypothetical protein GXY83_06665 [Rhodopirellula sp.]|nr:hypothetical protein [Rhodopirellula sp.]